MLHEYMHVCPLKKDERINADLGHAGKREWPAFKDWFARNLQPALNAWMGTVEVVYDGKVPLDPSKKYVFGYAPHGLFPIGAEVSMPCPDHFYLQKPPEDAQVPKCNCASPDCMLVLCNC